VRILFLAVLFLGQIGFCAPIIIYSTSTGKINLFISDSPDTSLFEGREDVLIHPDMSNVSGVPPRYWKVKLLDRTLVAMTQIEQDQVDADALAVRILGIRNGAKIQVDGFNSIGLKERSVMEMLVRELNILRRRDYGQIGIVAGNQTQNIIPSSWTIVTQFDSIKGYDGVSTGTVVLDKSSNKITINKTGHYFVE